MFIDAPAIEAFLAVAEGGSTHAGARALGISQASISRRISRLEVQMGAPLFLRSGHALALSAAGAHFLPLARQHFTGLLTAMTEIRVGGTGNATTVTLACLPTLALDALPHIMAELAQSRPGLRLRVLDLDPAKIERAVADSTADFALTMLGASAPELIHDIILDQPLALVVSERHPLAGRETMRWAELNGMRLIGMGPSSGHYHLLESFRPQIDVRWDEFHQVQRITTALAMVKAGNDPAILPLNLALNTPFGVHAITLTDPIVTRRIGILRRLATPLSPHADHVRRRIIKALQPGAASSLEQSSLSAPRS